VGLPVSNVKQFIQFAWKQSTTSTRSSKCGGVLPTTDFESFAVLFNVTVPLCLAGVLKRSPPRSRSSPGNLICTKELRQLIVVAFYLNDTSMSGGI
jgi:hypothetical protein